jgi:hypothetical protein
MALEALLQWVLIQLSGGPAQVSSLAARFVDEAGNCSSTEEWLSWGIVIGSTIFDKLRALEQSVGVNHSKLAAYIRSALALTLMDVSASPVSERADRLPISRAQEEARTFGPLSPMLFVKTHAHKLGLGATRVLVCGERTGRCSK